MVYMKRAGRRTILTIRRERLQLARKHWNRYFALAVFFAAVAGATMVLLSPLWRAFFAGVYITGYAALVGYSLMLDGSHFRM